MRISKEPFGTTPEGVDVDRYTFSNGRGVEVAMITYGAAIQALRVPDGEGRVANISPGFATLDDYLRRSPFFGATIGRYGNRIANGQFTLDGQTFQIPLNNGPNALHGGPLGFDRRIWHAEPIQTDEAVGVRFGYVSSDGDMGFPGTLTISVDYTVNTRDELVIEYHATTDKPTVVNLTNHNYFNLAGEGATHVYDHLLYLDADRFTPVDADLIPLGALEPVAGTPFDFTEPTAIGARIRSGHEQILRGRGYDHNFVLNAGPEWKLAGRVTEPTSGRVMEIETDQPGVQFYSGNSFDATTVGSGGHVYRQGDSFCLETQHFPDSPNRPDYPSTVLRPGEEYVTKTLYRFSVA